MRGWRRWTGRGAALAGLALAAACGTSPASIELDRLEGRWEWVSASGGIAGRTITPATEGYTMQVRFLDDGAAELFRNGARERTAEYELTVGRANGSFPDQDVVRFTPALLGFDEMAVQLEGTDELILADGCCDGFTYQFVRVGSAP